MALIKNIVGVALSNITNFGTSFIIGFILPAILSVSEYGYYREYSLYLSFAYLFNLGFNDGIYIKYGGKNSSKLDKVTVNGEHNFLLVFQVLILGLMLLISFLKSNIILMLFSIATFFISLNSYHHNFLQATGQFALYSKGNIFKSIFYLVILLIGILVFQSNNYVFYIILNIMSLVFVFIFYEGNRIKQYGLSMSWTVQNKKEIFNVGIYILIANMALTFVGNVGSWVVNFGFSIDEFAQYSFQNSVLNVILLIVNAVGMVFYSVISRSKNIRNLKIIKELSLLLGVIAGIAFFVFAYIIQIFLPKYIPAIPLLSMTFIAIPYIMISKILIANIYKSKRSEKKYLKDSILFAIFSFVLVYVVFLAMDDMVSIALTTTLCYIFWYIYTSRVEFDYLSGGIKEILLLFSHFVWFYACTNEFPIGKGFILYLIYIVIIIFLYRNRMKEIIQLYLQPR